MLNYNGGGGGDEGDNDEKIVRMGFMMLIIK